MRPPSTSFRAKGASLFVALGGACLSLSGCLSTSRATAVALDEEKPAYATEGCQAAIRAADVHEDLHTGRIIATPVLLVLTAGAAAPLLVGGNIALDASDRVDAAKMSEACGGPGKTGGEIAADVAGNAALGAATGAALDGVAGGGDGIASRLSRFLFGGATGTAAK